MAAHDDHSARPGDEGVRRRRIIVPPSGDSGDADPNVTQLLHAWDRGTGSERDALIAVAGTRLLVPVVALLTEKDEAGGEKESEMALPTLIGKDGRAAIIAFTGVETLRLWRPDARPVSAPAPRVWEAAVAEGSAVVIDVAGPVPFVIDGFRLAALAAGEQPPPPDLDPDIRAAIEAVIAGEPAITGVALSPGTDGADLAVTLRGADTEAMRRAAQAIAPRLASRLRRGIQLSASA